MNLPVKNMKALLSVAVLHACCTTRELTSLCIASTHKKDQKRQGGTCESPPSCTASQNIARLDCQDVDQSDSHGKQPAALTVRGESWVVKVLSYEQKLWVVFV